MKNFMPNLPGRTHAALGVLGLTAMLSIAVLHPGSELRAKQDETVAPVAAPKGLSVPSDMNQEEIERIDAAAAAKLGPQLRIIFDATATADARKAAIAEANAATAEIAVNSSEAMAMQRRITRRVALIEAALSAAEITDLNAPSAVHAAAVSAAAGKASSWLAVIPNGDSWTTYLHLAHLQQTQSDLAVLRQISHNMTITEGMSAEQSDFLNSGPLAELKATIDSAIAASSYDDNEDAARAELNRQLDTLVLGIILNEDDQLAADAEAAREAYRRLKDRFPAAADIVRPTLMSNYFNHNVHVTVSEVLLSRLMADVRTKSGSIADCIMGAWVTGSQVTDVSVAADIRPSSDTARFDIVANGNTRSNTTAQKSPATVYTQGNHYFHMVQPTSFDGRHASAGQPRISVDANNTTTGIRTEYDGIPLIGSIVKKIAAKEVAKSKGQSESLAASRISEEALPEFRNEVASQLADMNSTLDKLFNSLERKMVAPDSISARSSNTHIALSTRTMGTSRLGGSSQPSTVLSQDGMVLQIHETALNNSLDALGLGGRRIPENDITKELETALSDLLQRDIKLAEDEAAAPAEGEEAEPSATFIFSPTDPIRVHFHGNELVLVLRTGVAQEGKEEIPEQEITVSIALSVADGKVVLEPGAIGVSSQAETNRAKQAARAAQIRRILAKRFERKELDAAINLQPDSEKSLFLTITSIGTMDGWLTTEIH